MIVNNKAFEISSSMHDPKLSSLEAGGLPDELQESDDDGRIPRRSGAADFGTQKLLMVYTELEPLQVE